ncbi:MAG: hypothetical protein E6356_10955 [Terrisporobacter othiniensis]|uniref:hypothetical protein n=1 Tax=Terrisporobacter petrolearius TaxID=1460447 RepID=UPI0022E08BA7|nr:hypothetical protein [Terrisporobacter petrolearius]MDU4861712.1 hypothetical protein [Terrisporobacter othiniensis]MDU6995365.1 hypothetical protein [Terrisporobacter othiniensis]
MKDRRRLEQNNKSNKAGQRRRRRPKNMKSKKKVKEKKNIIKTLGNKIKNKNIPWILVIISISIGLEIGIFTDFSIKNLIEDISKYKISIVKEDDHLQEQETTKETKSDKINKAKKSIINSCGKEFKDVEYKGDGDHPTKIKGKYYIFKIGKISNMMFYVDKNTYEVFEYSADGYFGKYRKERYTPFENENK